MIIKLREATKDKVETLYGEGVKDAIKGVKKIIKKSPNMQKEDIKTAMEQLDELQDKLLNDIKPSKKTKTESVKLRENYDATYAVRSYYGSDYRGLEDKMVTEDWSEVEDFAHEKLMNGNFVKITNVITGNFLKCDPDYYQENFDGEFIWSPTDVELNDTPYYKGTYMESADDSLDDKVIGATKLVREMYDKFPDVDLVRERDFNDDEIMLMFSIKSLDKDRISEVESYLKSVGADYAIGFDRMKVFASKD